MTTAVGRSSLWLSLSSGISLSSRARLSLSSRPRAKRRGGISKFWVSAFLIFLFPILLSINPLVISPLAAQEFFEDFEPEDVDIEAGGALNVKNGAALHVQSGATLTVEGALTVKLNSATAFDVQKADETSVFKVNTNTSSVSIRQDLTLGTGGAPIIDIGSGKTLFIFPPDDVPHGKTIEVQGDISLSGNLFNPAFFEIQSNLADVENTLNDKMNLLSSLEKKVDHVSKEVQSVNREVQSVNKEVEIVKEVTNLSPEFIEFREFRELSKVAKEKNLRKKDLEPLISGHQSVADRLHTHEQYSNDVTFGKDTRVKGERLYIRTLPDRSEIVSFAHESMKALVSEAGVGWLVNGEASVKLDPRFLELVTISPSTPFFVQLTPGGDCKGLFVSRTSDTGFIVRELNGGTAAIPFYWKVDAFRRGLEGVSYVDPATYERLK